MAPPPVTEHGRSLWMHHGCRCGVCHRDLLAYSRVEGRGGSSAPWPGAGNVGGDVEVRRRVAELRAAGWSMRQVAAAAGVSEQRCGALSTGTPT